MGSFRNPSSDSFLSVDPANTPLTWKLDAKPTMPSKGKMVKNAASSFAKNLKSLSEGNPLHADPVEVDRRKAICNQCEHYLNGRCGKCGCWLQYKAALHAEGCPENKWSKS